jgi:hypothetical protein
MDNINNQRIQRECDEYLLGDGSFYTEERIIVMKEKLS